MPGVRHREDMEIDELDQDSDSDNFSDDSRSSDGSESEESSELDEEECLERRQIYSTDVSDIDKQFSILKETLYNERLLDVKEQLILLHNEQAEAYTFPLSCFKEAYSVRLEVAGVTRKLRLEVLQNKHEAELIAANQDNENSKFSVTTELEEDVLNKIEQLNQDRNNVAISTNFWVERNIKKSPKTPNQERAKRRKVLTMHGPYIVYSLKEEEIMEDWMAIKTAIQASRNQRKHNLSRLSNPRTTPQHVHNYQL